MQDYRQQAVIDQFDRDSATYLSRHLRDETQQEQKRLLELAAGRSYRRGLDLGCGPGTMSEALLSTCDEVWGVDNSEGMINQAIASTQGLAGCNRLHFETGSADTLRFPDEFFDIVFCVGVLRYLDSWEEGLREIYRILKPNGVVIVTFFYRFSPQWWSMVLLGRPFMARKVST